MAEVKEKRETERYRKRFKRIVNKIDKDFLILAGAGK